MRAFTCLAAAVLSGCYLHGTTLQQAKQPNNVYKSFTLDRTFLEVKQALSDYERACGQISPLRIVEDKFIRYSRGPHDDPDHLWAVVEMQPAGAETRVDAFVVVRTWRPFADRVIAAATNPTVCS
jgi:hypothetical protein